MLKKKDRERTMKEESSFTALLSSYEISNVHLLNLFNFIYYLFIITCKEGERFKSLIYTHSSHHR